MVGTPCGTSQTTTMFDISLATPTAQIGMSHAAIFYQNGVTISVVWKDANAAAKCGVTMTCISGGCLNAPIQPAATCFHVSTIITYKGKDYTLDEIKKHPECHVPHRVRVSDGVVLEILCEKIHKLQLTRDHLVFTSRGLLAAASVLPGDVSIFYLDLWNTLRRKVTRGTKGRVITRGRVVVEVEMMMILPFIFIVLPVEV